MIEPIEHGAPILVIQAKWLRKILDGDKTLEIRGTPCKKKVGPRVYLSASGSGTVCGSVTFVECVGPMDATVWSESVAQHRSDQASMPYATTYGWRFANPIEIEPVPYVVKKGSIVWRKFCPVGA